MVSALDSGARSLGFNPHSRQELIVLGFNDTSTIVGHFVSSPKEREKRDRKASRGDEREGQGRRRKMNESEETVVKTIPPLPPPAAMVPCPVVSQYQLDAPVTCYVIYINVGSITEL